MMGYLHGYLLSASSRYGRWYRMEKGEVHVGEGGLIQSGDDLACTTFWTCDLSVQCHLEPLVKTIL